MKDKAIVHIHCNPSEFDFLSRAVISKLPHYGVDTHEDIFNITKLIYAVQINKENKANLACKLNESRDFYREVYLPYRLAGEDLGKKLNLLCKECFGDGWNMGREGIVLCKACDQSGVDFESLIKICKFLHDLKDK